MTAWETMWDTNLHDGQRRASTLQRCPCCNQPTTFEKVLIHHDANTVAFRGKQVRLLRRGIEIMSILVKAFPAEVDYDRLIIAVWGVCEPADPRMQLRVQASLIRRRVQPIGLDIKAVYHCGYRLVML